MKISKKSWHYKLRTWFFRLDADLKAQDPSNLCEYIGELVFVAVLMIPVAAIAFGRWLKEKVCLPIEMED